MSHPKETPSSFFIDDGQSPIVNHPLTRFIMEQIPMILMTSKGVEEIMVSGDAPDETLDETLRNHKHFKGFYAFLAKESELYYQFVLRLDKIQHAAFMVDFFPTGAAENLLPITQAEYIENIMELYIMNCSALQDRLFEFVNFLYELKIPKDDVNKKQLVLSKLEDVALRNELMKLDQAFSGVRKSRNIIAHSGSFYNEELENIFQLEIRYRDRRARGEKIEGFDEVEQIDRLYKEYLYEEKQNIYINDRLITKIVVDVLDILYVKHKSILKRSKQLIGKYGKLRDSKKNSHTIRESTTLFKTLDLDELAKIMMREDGGERE